MSYGAVWDRNPKQIMLRLPDPAFAAAMLDGADRLAGAPTRLSRSKGPPFYGVDQRYVFDVDGHQVSLFFRYSQDEQWLHTTDVSVLPPL